MSFCAKCGAEVSPDSPFCGSCGAPVAGAEATPQAAAPTPPPPAAAPPPAPPAAGAPAYGPPAAPAGPAFQPPKSGGGGAKIAIFVLIGFLVIGAVVGVVLWLTLGGGDDDQAEIEKVVTKYYAAMEKGDSEALLALVDSNSLKKMNELAEEYGYDDAVELFDEFFSYVFPEDDLEITGVEIEVTINGEKATVETVGGKATYTDDYGDEVTETYKDTDGNIFDGEDLKLKKIDGKWYLQPDIENM